MADELKDLRVVTMMSPSELEEIDEWMFSNRIRSRGEAIRRLCRIGTLWDGISEDIRKQMEATIDDFKTHQDEALAVLAKPGGEVPLWVSKFVIAALRGNLKTVENFGKLGELIRMAGSPADAMKIKGKFSSARTASLMLEHDILQEALERFEAGRAEKSDKDKD